MKSYKAEGIAVRSVKLREADKIITFLTTQGKVQAIAKGVRRVNSRFSGRLEPGNDLDLVLVKGRSLDTVTQVQIKKARPWLRTDLEKLKTACAVLEMAEKLLTDQGQNKNFLALIRASLDQLESERRRSLLLLAFDIKAIAMSGFLPNLTECVICGSKAQLNKLVPAEGGCVCEGCYSGQAAIEAGDKTKYLVNELIAVRMKELDKVAADTGAISLVRKLIWAHITYHVHGNFKTRTQGGQIG